MLRIHLGPTPRDARVEDEDGNDIGRLVAISDIEVKASADGLATAKMFVEIVTADVPDECVEWWVKHPVTGDLKRLRAIEFFDGVRVSFGAGVPEVGGV
jgi:hypothetical protein